MTRSASPDRAPDPAATSAEWWRQAVVYQVCPHTLPTPAPTPMARAARTAGRRGRRRWPGRPAGRHLPDPVPGRARHRRGLAQPVRSVSPGRLRRDDLRAAGATESRSSSTSRRAHVSDRHPWFTEALADRPGSPATNRHIFRDGLGQAFTFDLLEAHWDAGEFLRVITDNLADAQQYGASASWVLSRDGASPRRARAAALLMLALPGSAYLYQGEELGRARARGPPGRASGRRSTTRPRP